ncbi:LysR family transcriptional regulator [Amylibacter sp. SFDW26]|uniref:LysR family transcriptional regulator n=1 Tax=Amylibacter sp. SFDW26 TaxID=2652722 RepID=UPI0012616DA6|nr:LysR family transcriptional regulator [Amylibacter sp. SFDW26]KAB7615965.1 LysR family transcriptional regulator [Amylibacter sp. SFDW26]
MHINLKQLEAFIWVADLGSFRGAADRLNTTQPNISSRISALETNLNVILMERDAGSVRLTTKGQHLLIHARQVIREAESFIEAADNTSLFDGVLRLGVTEMVVHTWLNDFLKALNDQFPKISVELNVDLSINLEKELSERSLDLALQYGPFKGKTSGSADLGTYPMIWVASPELNIDTSRKMGIEDIVKHPILTHSRVTHSFEEITQHFAMRRDLSARLVPSSNLAACLYMTMNGMGIGIMPDVMVAKELKNGELIQVQYDWTPEPSHFLARYDADKSAKFVASAAKIASDIAKNYAIDFSREAIIPV